MTTSGFDPEISNANLNAAQYYIDDDGALKFVSPYISSSNFDGTIPVVETTINAENIEPGMLLQVDAGEYLPVISVSYDDVDLESSPSSTITIGYVDSSNELNTIDYNFTDSVDVRYEDWANKDLGNQGWSITSGGNAIFANVGVRGDLEATTLDVGGANGITYDGSTVIIGASVVINAPVTFGSSSSYVTYDFLSASYADLSELATSGTTIINGGNITTGTVAAARIDTNNLIAKNIQTATTGDRVYIGSLAGGSTGDIYLYSSGASETAPGSIKVFAIGGKPKLFITAGTDHVSGANPLQLEFFAASDQIIYKGNQHTFQPNTSAATNVSITGNMSATNLFGNGSGLTNLPAGPYVLSTSGPSSPGSYVTGTVWYVY